MTMRLSTEVLVIAAGPAGAAAAHWAAESGRMVVLLEREAMPRERICGDALTPKAVGHLAEMGIDVTNSDFHQHHGLRMTAHGQSIGELDAIALDWGGRPPLRGRVHGNCRGPRSKGQARGRHSGHCRDGLLLGPGSKSRILLVRQDGWRQG